RLACAVRHPNVASLFDLSPLPGGGYYMVWEYIEGETLWDRLSSRGRMAPSEAVPIALEILAGLGAIHDAGVVHRDVSPDNVMLSRRRDGSEHAKIIDLGIARSVGDDVPRMTSTGMF